MGPNVLAVAPRRALALEGNDETRRRLEAAGVEVLPTRATRSRARATAGRPASRARSLECRRERALVRRHLRPTTVTRLAELSRGAALTSPALATRTASRRSCRRSTTARTALVEVLLDANPASRRLRCGRRWEDAGARGAARCGAPASPGLVAHGFTRCIYAAFFGQEDAARVGPARARGRTRASSARTAKIRVAPVQSAAAGGHDYRSSAYCSRTANWGGGGGGGGGGGKKKGAELDDLETNEELQKKGAKKPLRKRRDWGGGKKKKRGDVRPRCA